MPNSERPNDLFLTFHEYVENLGGEAGEFLDAKIAEPEFKVKIESSAAGHVSNVLPRLKQHFMNGLSEEQQVVTTAKLDKLTEKMEEASMMSPYDYLYPVTLSVSEIKLLKNSAGGRMPGHASNERKLYRKTVNSILKPFYKHLEKTGNTKAIDEIWPKKSDKQTDRKSWFGSWFKV